MTASRKASMTLALLLAVPALGLPTFSASALGASKTAHHRAADLGKANALVNPVATPNDPAPQGPETDGLSRKDDECNFGCIDH